MSAESAKAFMDRVYQDPSFARQLMECPDDTLRLKFALDQGYDFTVEEIRSAKRDVADEELDLVAGGATSGKSGPHRKVDN